MRIGSSDAYELPGGNEGLILHSVREHPRSRCISPPAYRLRRFWKTVAREALGNEWVVVMECFYVLCKWVKSDFCCRYVVWAGSWACPYGGTFDGYFGFLKYPLIGWVLFTSLFSYCVLASEWSATQILSQDTFLLHSLVRSPFPFHITGERSGFRFLFFCFHESGRVIIRFNVFPVFGTDGQRVVHGLFHNPGAVCLVGSYQIP